MRWGRGLQPHEALRDDLSEGGKPVMQALARGTLATAEDGSQLLIRATKVIAEHHRLALLLRESRQGAQNILALLLALSLKRRICLWVTIARHGNIHHLRDADVLVTPEQPVDARLTPDRRSSHPLARCIGDDAIEPGRKGALRAEACDSVIGKNEAILHDILSGPTFTNQQERQAQRRKLIASYQRLEPADIATLAATNGRAVVIVVIDPHNYPF